MACVDETSDDVDDTVVVIDDNSTPIDETSVYVDENSVDIEECFNDDDHPSKQLDIEMLCAFDLKNKENINTKIEFLRLILEQDVKAADLKWSLFVAACHSFRYDTCLRPFPPMFIKNETNNINNLRTAVEFVPPLSVLAEQLKEPSVYETKADNIELIFWALINLSDMHLQTVDKQNHQAILEMVDSQSKANAPDEIFEISSSKYSVAEKNWKKLAEGNSTFYAYLGNRLENFHSILYYGLQQHLCQDSEFSKGIYLSSELAVILPYSPVGYGWGGSILGSNMRCIALCEIIDHPDVKICTTNDNLDMKSEASVGQEPNKYKVVLNHDLVRIRYVLVYIENSKSQR